MGSSQKGESQFPEDMIKIGKTIEDIAAANQQVDTDIHMVSDSIDVMADTSDSLSDYTIYLKEKADKLKEASKSDSEDLEEIVGAFINVGISVIICHFCFQFVKIKQIVRRFNQKSFISFKIAFNGRRNGRRFFIKRK